MIYSHNTQVSHMYYRCMSYMCKKMSHMYYICITHVIFLMHSQPEEYLKSCIPKMSQKKIIEINGSMLNVIFIQTTGCKCYLQIAHNVGYWHWIYFCGSSDLNVKNSGTCSLLSTYLAYLSWIFSRSFWESWKKVIYWGIIREINNHPFHFCCQKLILGQVFHFKTSYIAIMGLFEIAASNR